MLITLCSSAVFYRELLDVEEKLRALGHETLVPVTAERMRENGNFEVNQYKTWYDDPADFDKKAELMRLHLDKVKRGDAVLVVNMEKNGIRGYIGGNVLLEMFYAWIDGKPIYILNPVSPDLPLYEEVLGMSPVMLNDDVSAIR